jgi:hypothetical protein
MWSSLRKTVHVVETVAGRRLLDGELVDERDVELTRSELGQCFFGIELG